MKYVLISTVVTGMLLAGAGIAAAQTSFNRPSRPGITDPYQTGLHVYSKTWADLNVAQKRVIPNPGDWYRYDVARGQMDLLQHAWQDGSFTRAQLINAINDVQFVLNQNHIADGDRQALEQDLNQLRDIRLRYGD